MPPYFVYILLCTDGTLYTGIAKDPERRLLEHNSGVGSKYTRSRLPAAMVHIEKRGSRSDALKREVQIKRMSRDAKLLLCGLGKGPWEHR